MEEILREPVELTEFELDAVAGGNPFSNNAFAGEANQITSSQGFGGVVGDVFAGVAVIGNAGIFQNV